MPDDDRAEVGDAIDVPHRGNRDGPAMLVLKNTLDVAVETRRHLIHGELGEPALVTKIARGLQERITDQRVWPYQAWHGRETTGDPGITIIERVSASPAAACRRYCQTGAFSGLPSGHGGWALSLAVALWAAAGPDRGTGAAEISSRLLP